jgi:hypothetical protein
MTDHDRLFKELLTTFFVEFVELFFPTVADYLDPGSIAFLDKEIFTDIPGGERREADIVVRARFRERPAFFLIHLEHQAQAEAEFSLRMFRYFARLYEKYNLPVYPIALFSYVEPLREEPTAHEVAFPDLSVLSFTYRVIQLNRLNWRDFVRKQNPVASALMARMGIDPADCYKVKIECLRLLATLRLDPARAHLISGFIDTYLRLSRDELRLFREELATILPAEREGVMEIMTSWMEEGLQQGLQQGERNLVLRQLTRRFGKMPAEIQASIGALPITRLEQLGEDLLDFGDIADLRNWLDKHATMEDGE